jgi:prepilin-type N-terminal cleavage/methylation domain-containing protein
MTEKRKKRLSKNGFTLIEVMAAVTVLSIGLIGSLTLISYNLHNISFSGDRIIASGLVEDGLERVRNIRDTNWLKGGATAWNSGIEGDISPDTTIKFFCHDNTVTANLSPSFTNIDDSGCSGSTGKCRVYLFTDGSGNQCYSDNFSGAPVAAGYTATATKFYRLITLDDQGSANHVKVKVVLKWSEGAQDKYLTAEEVLYNWQ